jgi:serine/threonine-protein kinase
MKGKAEINIIEYFKTAQLETDVGEFSYVEMLGQGGNTKVLSFKKGEDNFAVKFIPHTDKGKLNRFKDEYFCAIQINMHENIAHLYLFDSIKIEEEDFSIIIMKQYASSLKKLGTISKATDDEKALLGLKLMNALANGLNHLHQNAIIHRDIKPENIFFDSDNDIFVIGDLGIANFSKDFPKEALTVVGERLSNYLYSPPDQVSLKDKPNPTWDIYALGQVLSWYLYDLTIRGDGREAYSGANADLKILDKIIHRCVQNDPLRRFSTISELRECVFLVKNPPKIIAKKPPITVPKRPLKLSS